MFTITLTEQERQDLIELFEDIRKHDCMLDETWQNILDKLLTNN